MVKILHALIKGLGPAKFTVVYAIIFTALINGIAVIVNAIMKYPPWSTTQFLMYVVGYFIVGIFLARQLIKKIRL